VVNQEAMFCGCGWKGEQQVFTGEVEISFCSSCGSRI